MNSHIAEGLYFGGALLLVGGVVLANELLERVLYGAYKKIFPSKRDKKENIHSHERMSDLDNL